jgi:hypothetical protein
LTLADQSLAVLIQSFRVANYKSYLDSNELKLSPGFNLIVGQNNVGKTALVEALSLHAAYNPHRSLKTVPTRQTPLLADGIVKHVFALTRDEGWTLLRELGSPLYLTRAVSEDQADTLTRVTNEIQNGAVLASEFSLANQRFVSVHFAGTNTASGANTSVIQCTLRKDGLPGFEAAGQTNLDGSGSVSLHLANKMKDRLYAFKAERLNISESPHGNQTYLNPDARNLPQVLSFLQTSNPDQWDLFLLYVRSVLPQVSEITVPDKDGNNVQINVWSIPAKTQRADLAIPLAHSGTGIGQVLAILYVILTADTPQTVIIDEPQSFLHPGAVRKLFDILRLYQHQYVVVTHSPTVVDAASPPTLFLIRSKDGESAVSTLSAADADDLRTFLGEIGARPSDVFGSDRVLWVEGRTEETAFPVIMASHPEIRMGATAILAVRHTSDFQKRDAKAAVDIYRRLSAGPTLMPPTVGFVFDRELLTPSEIEDLKRETGGAVAFTQRRMFENYLLNPEAITVVINSINGFAPTPVTTEAVRSWMTEHRWDKEFFNELPPEPMRSAATWQRDVNGGQFLQRLFSELSEKRVEYDKPRHGLALTTWMCNNAIHDFDEIVAVVSYLLQVAAKESEPTAA